MIHDEFSDHWVPPVPGDDGLDQELAGYDAGRFLYYGRLLRVAWADADESRRLRETHFNAQVGRTQAVVAPPHDF